MAVLPLLFFLLLVVLALATFRAAVAVDDAV
jgi:hypothetical protein